MDTTGQQNADGSNDCLDPAFTRTVNAFRAVTAGPAGVGGQLSIRSGRRLLVSVAVGDDGHGRPFSPATTVNVWSVGKALAAVVVAATLRQSGGSLADPVVRWWPAARLDEEVTVGDALGHRLGLVGLRRPVTATDLLDRGRLGDELARTEPWWVPGTAFGYHSWTFGVIVDQILRAAGTDAASAADSVLDRPAKTGLVSFGAPVGQPARLVDLEVPSSPDLAALVARTGPETQAALRNPSLGHADTGSSWWPDLVLPSVKAAANADGATQVLAELVDPRLLAADDVAQLLTGRGRGIDRVLGDDREFTAGLVVGHPDSACPYSTDGRLRYGHDGMGGSFVCVDPATGLTLAWVTNAAGLDINRDPRKLAILEAFDDDTR